MTDAELLRALRLLELNAEALRPMREARSASAAEAAVTALQNLVKKAFRKAAPKLHPDRTGGDAAKAEDFKLVAAFMDEVERMSPPALPKRVVRRYSFRIEVRMLEGARVL